MRTWRIRFWLLLAGVVLLAPGCTRRSRPNVILISVDTLRADHLGAYGFERFPISPNFDRLGKKSVLFTSAFANGSVTTASHMSLFTGLFPDQHGVNNVVRAWSRDERVPSVLSPAIKTLPEILRSEGYATARFVYARDFFLDSSLGFGRGFELDFPYGLDSLASSRAVADWIRGAGERPFFAFIHTKRPHAPYIFDDDLLSDAVRKGWLDATYRGPVIASVNEWTEKFEGKDWFNSLIPGLVPDCWHYEAMVRKGNPGDKRRVEQLYALGVNLADIYLGIVLTSLEESGLLDDTIVVLTSDHGEQLMQRGQLAHRNLHREELNVPLLIHVPPRLAGKGLVPRVHADVQSVDVLPTVLGFLGLGAPGTLAGRDLRPLMRGEAAGGQTELYAVNRIREVPHTAALRTAEWSLVQGEDGRFALFDRKTDRLELRDVATANPAALAELRARLKRLELDSFSFRYTPGAEK